MRQTSWIGWLLGACGVFLSVTLASPVLVLWLPGPWKRHVDHEIAFEWIATHELSGSNRPREVIRSAMTYTRTHLWLVDNPQPYRGKPFDYLVEGIGWCDYQAKVFCKLLTRRRMPHPLGCG